DDQLVFLETQEGNLEIVEIYRLNWAVVALIIFILLAVIFAGRRGLASFVGLVATVATLVGFIVPQILDGKDPLLVSLVGGSIVSIVSIYLAHGLYTRTTIAVVATIASIVFAAVFATVFVGLTALFGLGSEEALFIQSGGLGEIDLRGILLGGIIIGTLGVLDDITTTQAATIEQLHLSDPKATLKELYHRGQSVGVEHISSLINTLVLAYAGASFPIFILLVANNQEPLWFTLNNEYFIEELVRTIVGSATLILAVPISTLLAAWWYTRARHG
ncbi:MAG: YibE/F family protein, partial [Candidatus Dojkabacteria bacterium]